MRVTADGEPRCPFRCASVPSTEGEGTAAASRSTSEEGLGITGMIWATGLGASPRSTSVVAERESLCHGGCGGVLVNKR